MKKLLIVALLLTLLVPMVIETSFAQEPEVVPSSDRIFRRKLVIYIKDSPVLPSYPETTIQHNKIYRGTLNLESSTPKADGTRAIYSGYLYFTGIYQYGHVTPY